MLFGNKKWPHRAWYASLGALLGLGSPLGALGLRILGNPGAGLWSPLASEWAQNRFLYVYMTVGTIIAFALFGYFLGGKGDVLEEQKKLANALAITDGLTALYNHRYLHEHMAAEVERAQRYQTPLTCLMLDIDNFKTINDTYGHPSGDDVLRIIANIIREQVRRVDTAGRYGGEEFLVLMPHTAPTEALPVAERIRAEVQEFPFRFEGRDVHVTLSIGLATYDSATPGCADKGGLLKAVDEALYQAKNRGKNRTQLWTATPA